MRTGSNSGEYYRHQIHWCTLVQVILTIHLHQWLTELNSLSFSLAINWGTNYLGSSGPVTCRRVTLLFVSVLMWLNNKTCSSTQTICSFKHPICLKGTDFNLALSVCWLLHGWDSFMTLSLLLSALPQNYTLINPHGLLWQLFEYTKTCPLIRYLMWN